MPLEAGADWFDRNCKTSGSGAGIETGKKR